MVGRIFCGRQRKGNTAAAYTENNVILHYYRHIICSVRVTRSSSDLIAGLRYCITFLNRRQYRHKALRMLELRLDYVKYLGVHRRCIRAGTKKDTRSTTSPLLVIFADEHTTEPPISSAPNLRHTPPRHPSHFATPSPLGMSSKVLCVVSAVLVNHALRVTRSLLCSS